MWCSRASNPSLAWHVPGTCKKGKSNNSSIHSITVSQGIQGVPLVFVQFARSSETDNHFSPYVFYHFCYRYYFKREEAKIRITCWHLGVETNFTSIWGKNNQWRGRLRFGLVPAGYRSWHTKKNCQSKKKIVNCTGGLNIIRNLIVYIKTYQHAVTRWQGS